MYAYASGANITQPLLGDRERTSTTFRRCVPWQRRRTHRTRPSRSTASTKFSASRRSTTPPKKILVLTSSMRGERGLCHQHSRSMCVRQTLEQPRRGGEDALNVIRRPVVFPRRLSSQNAATLSQITTRCVDPIPTVVPHRLHHHSRLHRPRHHRIHEPSIRFALHPARPRRPAPSASSTRPPSSALHQREPRHGLLVHFIPRSLPRVFLRPHQRIRDVSIQPAGARRGSALPRNRSPPPAPRSPRTASRPSTRKHDARRDLDRQFRLPRPRRRRSR